MKRLILPALLLLASTTHATITNYRWEGTVDSGNIPETTASGSFTTDTNTVFNPDAPGSFDGGLKNISLNLGNSVYNNFNSWTFWATPDGSGVMFADCVLSGPQNFNDLGFYYDDTGGSWNVFLNGYTEIKGTVTRLWTDQPAPQVAFNDAAPTPEPSSGALMAASALTAGAFFWWKRRIPRLKEDSPS